jgi:hypothetical protein
MHKISLGLALAFWVAVHYIPDDTIRAWSFPIAGIIFAAALVYNYRKGRNTADESVMLVGASITCLLALAITLLH